MSILPAPIYEAERPDGYEASKEGYEGSEGSKYESERPSYEASEGKDFRREALDYINKISRQDQERAIERVESKPFGFLSGALRLLKLRNQAEWVDKKINKPLAKSPFFNAIAKTRAWFDSAGERSVSDDSELDVEENLARAGNFAKNPSWKKGLKIALKMLGGVGLAGLMVMTSGAGIATAALWSGGVREAYDGVAQGIENVGWGNKRVACEIARQNELSEPISRLKARVVDREHPITEEEFCNIISEIAERDRILTEQEQKNHVGELKGRAIRGIATSVATLGTGLMAGVPLGKVNYDQDNTALANSVRSAAGDPSMAVMNDSHRAFWSATDGGQFAYEHSSVMDAVRDTMNGNVASGTEYDKLQSLTNYLNHTLDGKFGTFDLSATSVYGQTTHALGQGLSGVDVNKLELALAYLTGVAVSNGYPSKTETPYETPRTPYEGTRYEPSRYEPRDGYVAASASSGGGGPGRSPSGEIPPIEPALIEEAKKAPATDEEATEREKKITEAYLDKKPEPYHDLLKDFERTIPPMKDSCRFAVCVPAAYSEHRVIYDYLASYLGQENSDGTNLDADSYEINIFVNGTTDKASDIAKTVEEINRFKKDHPDINVNVIDKSFEARQPIGYLRSLITDLVLLRSSHRAGVHKSLAIVNHDADIQIADKQYFAKAEKNFDNDYDAKILSPHIDYSPEVKKKYPFLWVARRLWQFMDIVRTSPTRGGMQRKAVGANSFMRADAYALAGGYGMYDTVAEDLNLANKIEKTFGRVGTDGESKTIKPVADGMRCYISERRDISQLAEGKPLIRGYDDFQGNDAVREELKIDEAELQDINPDNDAIFAKYLEQELASQYNHLFYTLFYRYSDASPEIIEARRLGKNKAELTQIEEDNISREPGQKAIDETNKVFTKVCGFMGIKASLEEIAGQNKFKCKIDDWSGLKDDLKNSLSKI